jgi:DNA modification methylase
MTNTNQTIQIAAYQPHPRNYNRHSPLQVQRIAASLNMFGQVRSVVVCRGHFLAGHGVREAALSLGWKELRADVLPDDYPEELALAYLAADNELSRLSDPDNAQLAQILEESRQYDDQLLAAIGYDDKEFDALLREVEKDAGLTAEPSDAEAQIDKAAVLLEKWQVQPGDLWRIGDHVLACGDCTDPATVARVMGGEKADMMFTDPPYGVDYSGGIQFQKDGSVQKNNRKKLAGDADPALYAKFLPVVLPFVDGPCYMWFADRAGKPVYDAVIGNKCDIHALIIWHKTNATYAAMNAQYKQRHEPCMYFKPRKSTLRWCGASTESTLWEVKRDAQNEFHPTQKPVELSMRAIGNHEVKIVADFFAGSGSTIVGAQNCGVSCRAIEISPAYCAVILQRMADAFPTLPIERVANG